MSNYEIKTKVKSQTWFFYLYLEYWGLWKFETQTKISTSRANNSFFLISNEWIKINVVIESMTNGLQKS